MNGKKNMDRITLNSELSIERLIIQYNKFRENHKHTVTGLGTCYIYIK